MIELKKPRESQFKAQDIIYRKGIELEKGVIITEDWLKKNEELMYDQWCLYTAYPDIYLDEIKNQDSNFELFFYQRMFLRACMRYTTIYITAARATSKTFLSILAKYLQCVFIPHHVGSIVAPNKGQAAKITKQKIQEIWRLWPLLEKELEVYQGEPHANFGKDYVELFFKNGSRLTVTGALDSDRGIRTHATLIDETRKIYIHKIINQVTGEKYVGQTTNFSRRIEDHFYQLDKGTQKIKKNKEIKFPS